MARKMEINRTNALIVVLLICLVIAVGYIAVEKYTQSQQKKQAAAFKTGAQYGYQQAVLQLAQQAATCQPVPLFVQNSTINLIAVECLNKQAPQEAQ